MQETLQELQRAYKQYRRLVFVYLPLLAAAIICVFLNRYLTLGLLGAALLYQLFYLRPKQKQYQSRVNRENLLHTVCKVLGTDDVQERDGGAVTLDVIRNAGLVPVDGGDSGSLLCQGVSGTVEDISVAVCDATLAESFRLVEKGKHRVHFNAGCWMHFTLPEDTGCDWRILREDAVPTPMRLAFFQHSGLELAKLGGFEKFLCYRGETSPKPASPVLCELRRLAEYTPGKVAISLRGNTMDLFLQGRFLARPVSMASPPTEKQLAFDPLPELSYGVQMAKAVMGHK